MGFNPFENYSSGGEGFTPTDAQLDAMNSGITSEDVEQISTNKSNILSTCCVGTCTTSGNVAAKIVTIDDANWTLRKGCIIAVKFSNSNSVTDTESTPITLNVNNTGAYRIWYKNGAYVNASQGKIFGYAGYYVYYMFDGVDRWLWVNYSMDNTYSTMSQSEASAGTSTNERLITAKVLSDTIDEKIQPLENNISIVDITSDVTAESGYTVDSMSHLYRQGKHVFGTLVIKKASGNFSSASQETVATIGTYAPEYQYLGISAFTNTIWTVQNIGYVFVQNSGASGAGGITVMDTATTNNCVKIPIDYVTA